MNDQEQKILAEILCLFADRFGNKSILRGGMVLKLLGSQRYTNDLDYIFVPYRSKNEIVAQVIDCLQSIPNAQVLHSLNSKCLRVIVKVEDVSVQIEAKVGAAIKTEVVSNKLFSDQYNLPRKLIHIVDHSVSMANKLAAWNERRIMRDIYDIWFFVRMGVRPDKETLDKRLQRPLYAKSVSTQEYFQGKNSTEFLEFVQQNVNHITQKDVEAELSDYFAPDELVGIASLFKAGMVSLKMG